MSLNVFWFIPTHGDSRYLGTTTGARPVNYDYMRQVAVAADTLGYDGVLLPTGRSCEDAWVTASSLISATQRLKFLVAMGEREVASDSVVGALWPDLDGDAGHAFESTLHRLRKLLRRDDAILHVDGRLTLNPQLVWVDAWALEHQLGRAEEAFGSAGEARRSLPQDMAGDVAPGEPVTVRLGEGHHHHLFGASGRSVD